MGTQERHARGDVASAAAVQGLHECAMNTAEGRVPFGGHAAEHNSFAIRQRGPVTDLELLAPAPELPEPTIGELREPTDRPRPLLEDEGAIRRQLLVPDRQS